MAHVTARANASVTPVSLDLFANIHEAQHAAEMATRTPTELAFVIADSVAPHVRFLVPIAPKTATRNRVALVFVTSDSAAKAVSSM